MEDHDILYGTIGKWSRACIDSGAARFEHDFRKIVAVAKNTDLIGKWEFERDIGVVFACGPFNYIVEWKIDIDAYTPKEAAEQAKKIMQDPDSHATFFEVTDENGDVTGVDLEYGIA